MTIHCIGVNHETAGVGIREKLSLAGQDRVEALHRLSEKQNVKEVMILSTCNRIEFYLAAEADKFCGLSTILRFYRQYRDLNGYNLDQSLYSLAGQAAVEHLFRVVSGMDSMVIGEPQITGQVKDAYRIASEEKVLGTLLNRLLHKSFTVSKRVRTETELASRAVSVSYVAVELAKKIFGDLDERKAMLAGAGEMAELAAKHLANHGVSRILVASRTLEHARELAASFQGSAITLEQMTPSLAEVDILICSTASPTYILGKEQIQTVMQTRKQRPVFIIDISVPRNIDPEVNQLENVYLYDMDDLQKVLAANLEERRKELKKAEMIVKEEVVSYFNWLNSLDLVPTITFLRKNAEEIRRKEVEKAFSLFGNGVNEKQKKAVEAMSQAIVNKILHTPIAQLKMAEKEGEGNDLVDAVRHLFALCPPKG